MRRPWRRRTEDSDEPGLLGGDVVEPALKGTPAAGEARRPLTPVDIQQKVFRLAFRGYNERDVDEFLDVITEDLARLHEENKRIQEALEETQKSIPPSAAQAHREAEELVRRAREQASRLVESAEARAAATGPGPAPSWFLREERDFLERLGGLIRDHAESLKREARLARERQAEEPLAEEAAVSTVPPAAPEPTPGEVRREEARVLEGKEREPVGAGAGRAAQDPFGGWANPFEAEREEEEPSSVSAPALSQEPASAEIEGANRPAPPAEGPGPDEQVSAPPSPEIEEEPSGPIPERPGRDLELEEAPEPPRPSEPEPTMESEPATAQETTEPEPTTAQEAREPETDDEERSLRELFWGEE